MDAHHLAQNTGRVVKGMLQARPVLSLSDELTFKIDPGKKPKQIDMADPKDKDAKPVPCIYSLEGDELKLCLPLVAPGKKDDAARPESFDTKDKKLMTFICKRQKS